MTRIEGLIMRRSKYVRPNLMPLEDRTVPAVFSGGVTVASGDVNGDGNYDLITGAGRGGQPIVNIYDGNDGTLTRSFFAFDKSFTGGVFVAAGDVNGDGKADIICGAGQTGGPHVRIFDGVTGSVLLDFFAYDASFHGGVRVAAGDMNSDGKADIFTAAGPGGGPHVEVFDGASGRLLRSTYTFDPKFGGGVYIAAADMNGDGKADMITGAGEGGQPIVNVLDASNNFQLISTFFAYDKSFTGGVRVAATDAYYYAPPPPPGYASIAIVYHVPPRIMTGAGPGGGAHVKVFGVPANDFFVFGAPPAGPDTLLKEFFAYDVKFTGGVFVAGSRFTNATQNKIDSPDIITGPGASGGPNVRGFDGDTAAPTFSFYAYDNDGSDRNNPGQFGDRTAPVVTITTPTDSPTLSTNLTVEGVATDFGSPQPGDISRYVETFISVDYGPQVPLLAFSSSSDPGKWRFSFTTSFKLDGTDDGNHTLIITAKDAQGNVGGTTVNFTLETAAITPLLSLADASDTGTKGDLITSLNSVTINGTTEPNVAVTLTQTGAKTTADANGNFSFNGVPLVLGANSFDVVATKSPSLSSTGRIIIRLNSGPVVASEIADITVNQGAADQVIDLATYFTDADLINSHVQFNTSAGAIDVELFDQTQKLTVANFLNYVDSGRYTQSIFHRLVNSFVLQGGGYTFNSDAHRLDAIPTDPAVQNEPGRSNVRGTLSMAKLSGNPNSATSQFFFNLGDNSANLDEQNGGFTVFGQVASGMNVIDTLASYPITNQGGVFNELPLKNYTGTNFPTDTVYSNYAGVNSIAVTQRSDKLTYSVSNNDNTGLVTTSIVGGKLTLHYNAGQTGSANITIRATDQTGSFIEQTFTVTVS